MTEILIGLSTLAGLIVAFAMILSFSGLLYIFFHNLFTKEKDEYIEYTWGETITQGWKGIAMFLLVIALIVLCFLIGCIVTGKLH